MSVKSKLSYTINLANRSISSYWYKFSILRYHQTSHNAVEMNSLYCQYCLPCSTSYPLTLTPTPTPHSHVTVCCADKNYLHIHQPW